MCKEQSVTLRGPRIHSNKFQENTPTSPAQGSSSDCNLDLLKIQGDYLHFGPITELKPLMQAMPTKGDFGLSAEEIHKYLREEMDTLRQEMINNNAEIQTLKIPNKDNGRHICELEKKQQINFCKLIFLRLIVEDAETKSMRKKYKDARDSKN